MTCHNGKSWLVTDEIQLRNCFYGENLKICVVVAKHLISGKQLYSCFWVSPITRNKPVVSGNLVLCLILSYFQCCICPFLRWSMLSNVTCRHFSAFCTTTCTRQEYCWQMAQRRIKRSVSFLIIISLLMYFTTTVLKAKWHRGNVEWVHSEGDHMWGVARGDDCADTYRPSDESR